MKKMMKFILLALFILLLSACGGSSGDGRTGDVQTCVWGTSTWESGCNWAK